MAVRREAAVPTPPRTTGNQEADLFAQINWANDFYRATVVESGLLDPEFQADASAFTAESLPDPEASSIALAQKTANEAYNLGAATAAKAVLLITPFTLEESDNQIAVTFATAFAGADDYRVMCQTVDFAGTPAAEAFIVTRVERTAAGFTVTLADAPGAGASVSYLAFIFGN
jgi:hypothetical protein